MVNLIVNNILYVSDRGNIYLMTCLRHIKQLKIVAEYLQLKVTALSAYSPAATLVADTVRTGNGFGT